jgi:hypothetical protein
MVVSSQGTQITKLDRVEIAAEPWRWEFAMAQHNEITRYFAHQKRKQPGLWNGQILLLHRYTISNRVLHGRCFITEFANLLAWRDWNYPDPSIQNFFAAAGLCAADGGYLVGEMGRIPQTQACVISRPVHRRRPILTATARWTWLAICDANSKRRPELNWNVAAETIEREIGQVGQTQKAASELNIGSAGVFPRVGYRFHLTYSTLRNCMRTGGIGPPEYRVNNVARIREQLAVFPIVVQMIGLNFE